MATIGSFKKEETSFTETINTLNMTSRLRFI